MTRTEFETRFTELMKDPAANLDAIATFRMEVLTDYTTAESLNTTMNTTKERIESLTTENAKLKETNMQLFMMNPTATQTDPAKTTQTDPAKTTQTDTDTSTTQEDKQPSIDDVLSDLIYKPESKGE